MIRCFYRAMFGSATGTADSSAPVYGCFGVAVERVALGHLDDLAQVHHGDPVGHVLHDRQVVRDEQVRELELLLQVVEEVQDLRLDRDVERRDGFVAHDQLRAAARARARRRSAAAVRPRTRADSGCSAPGSGPTSSISCWTSLLTLLAHRRSRAAGTASPMIEPIVLRGFSDAYGSWKIICMSRPELAELGALERGDVLALEPDLALGGIEQPHHDARERRLAAARLPDQAERLTGIHLEVHAVDRVDVADLVLDQDAARDREVLLDPLDLDERLAGRRRGRFDASGGG